MEEQFIEVTELPEEMATQEETAPSAEEADAALLAEAALLRQSYPDFDLDEQMQDPLFKSIIKGEISLNLRQAYELCNNGRITENKVAAAVNAAVADAVEKAVSEAVSRAVAETEERMLAQIRARGQRPSESGLRAAIGVKSHPAVGRLTKADRERLARRASRGETICL